MTRMLPIKDSSWLASIEYYPVSTMEKQGFIHLLLTSGKVLVYGPVPSWVPGLFLAAKSKGKFFNQKVRNTYPFWDSKEQKVG